MFLCLFVPIGDPMEGTHPVIIHRITLENNKAGSLELGARKAPDSLGKNTS